jgi:hypothetical protein
MVHANNPSYSEGRDQEDCSLKPAYLENTLHKIGLVEWLKAKALS